MSKIKQNHLPHQQWQPRNSRDLAACYVEGQRSGDGSKDLIKPMKGILEFEEDDEDEEEEDEEEEDKVEETVRRA